MELVEEDATTDPIQQFKSWRQEAHETGEAQPDSMALATVGKDCRPSARFVMLRAVETEGFVFYTNYSSRKAQELADNPWASLVTYWPRSERQVRVEGVVERVAEGVSDAYFLIRPRESQLEAWASPQSQVIPNRAWLEGRWRDYEDKLPEQVLRPDWWGGYRLRPSVMEFWQQRPHRMHDRLRYQKEGDGKWSLERLAP